MVSIMESVRLESGSPAQGLASLLESAVLGGVGGPFLSGYII